MANVERNATYATGRRKKAVARVWMMPGSGKVTINHRDGGRGFYFRDPSGHLLEVLTA